MISFTALGEGFSVNVTTISSVPEFPLPSVAVTWYVPEVVTLRVALVSLVKVVPSLVQE